MRASGGPNRVCKISLPNSRSAGYLGTTRAALAFVLCVLMVDQPLLAATAVPKRGPTAGGAQTKGEGRVLHALNRLTFGPRPGDVAAVEAMGLTNWFEMQLNPSGIDDTALDGRLAAFPAMQLPQAELLARYPSQQMIRQMEQQGNRQMALGNVPAGPRSRQMGPANSGMPTDPVERAIYGDELAFYRMQQEKQAEAKAAAPAANAMIGDTMTANPMAGDAMTASAGQTPAPIERRAPSAQAAAAATPAAAGAAPDSGNMEVAPPDYAAIAAGNDAGNPTAMLPKSELVDTGQAPDQHVEKLFKNIEAVKIINLPPDERMRKVIAMAPNDFVAFRQSLSAAEVAQFTQGLGPQQREIFAAMQNSTRMIGAEEMQVRLLRDIYSDRQLEAVMTDFWLNHFNVYVRKNQNEPYLIPAYERDVVRPNALGKFEDLLAATAKSPAMLMYLDNWTSIGPDSPAAKQGPAYAGRFARPGRFGAQPPLQRNPQVQAALKDRGLNENYGRELMELHTLGVNGGYTQKDVTEVAKVFTGWTVAPPQQGGGFQFQFEERRHQPGSKTVLGKTIKENGMNEGLEVLHMLATSPATAKFISTELAVRFVSDDPPPALVDQMAQSFLASDGDIKTVLRTMFESPEFWAPAAERSKVKTPEEFVVSAVRAGGATVNNSLALVQALDKLGMPLYGMQTPNGYSWMSEPWVSTGALVSRMNFALLLAGDRLPGVRTDWTKLLGGPSVAGRQAAMEAGDGVVDPEVAAKERKLELILLGQPLSDKTRAAVLGQSNDLTAAMQAAKDFQIGAGGAGAVGVFAPGGAAAQRNAVPDDRQAAVMAGLMLGSPEFQRR
jgi:uncharacterized protein (DUF1800 family)